MYNFDEMMKVCSDCLSKYDMSETQINNLQIVIYKLKNINSIIENVDADLLKSMDNDFINCSELINSLNAGAIDSIQVINEKLDFIITKLTKYIDYSQFFNSKSRIKDYIKQYKNVITREKAKTQEESDKASEKIRTILNNLNDSNYEVNEKIIDLNKKLQGIENNQSQLDTRVNKYLEEKTQHIDTKISKEEEQMKNEYQNLLDKYTEKFENLDADLQAKHKNVTELVGLVTNEGKIGEYKKNADELRKERRRWQKLTIVVFVISIIISLVSMLANWNDKFSIKTYIISAVLMTTSAYTAKQASNARKDEVYYRKQQLELSTIDAYLEGMEPNEKKDIKKELSNHLFGQAKNTYTNKYDDSKGISADNMKMFEELAEIFKKIKDNL